MNVHEIFHHFVRLYKNIADKSDFYIDSQLGLLIASKIHDDSFNIFELEKLDSIVFTELQHKINAPFLCLPGNKVSTVDFENFMRQENLIKADVVHAKLYSNLQSFKYENNILNLKVKLVENHSDLVHFDKLSSISFKHKEGNLLKFFHTYAIQKYKMENLYLFLAELDGIPVGTSILATHDNLAGLYWDSVHPEYREMGIASAMVKKRMDLARHLGHDKIFCQAESPSRNLYRRLGFISVGSLPTYISKTVTPAC
jgi:ribosomal protein S18 acetylase RimI-like enzyme